MHSERKPNNSTVLTMERVPLRSNFSIDAILPEIVNRAPSEPSPAPSPSTVSDAGDSSDGDVNVDLDYESEIEGKNSFTIIWIISHQVQNKRKTHSNLC